MNSVSNTIPDYESIMLPLLKFVSDKQEHSFREAVDFISSHFNLTENQKKELLPSGQQYIINNRVGWARTYLKKAGLLESPKRSYFKITERGLKVLESNPNAINGEFLKQFPEFVEFKKFRRESEDEQEYEESEPDSQTPQESLEYAYQRIREDMAQEILGLVKQCSPKFFEKLVVELLLKMGYGGSQKDAGKAVGRSGDSGIDGIIKQDKLGLDVIFIQAKRWENVVGAGEIRNFVGSLAEQKANKGVFITTSKFTEEAKRYVTTIQHKVILIDGEILAQLMFDHDVGVSKVSSYEIKKIDSDYFAEE